jgi:hypothetical protein
MDIALDRSTVLALSEHPDYFDHYKAILARDVKIRCITEVTPENISICKRLVDLVSEIRHLDDLKSSIVINESEYLATTIISNEKPLTKCAYDNTSELVAQGQYLFDTLWSNSIPALRRIKEIEYGLEPVKTKFSENTEEITSDINKIIKESKNLCMCVTIDVMQSINEHYIDINKKVLQDHKQKKHKDIQWITSVDSRNHIDQVKRFAKVSIKVRHTKDRPTFNFVVSDKYVALITEKIIGEEFFLNLLFSNDPLYVRHFCAIFSQMWKQSVYMEERIKELTYSELFETKIISDPQKTLTLIKESYSLAKKEILIILPSFNNLKLMINSKSLEIL